MTIVKTDFDSKSYPLYLVDSGYLENIAGEKMKKLIHRLSIEELRKYPISNVVEGWFFRVEEITPGYYRVSGIDEWGRTVSRDGIDPDELMVDLDKDIHELR